MRANGVESWVKNQYATEYWRLYQSGQFLHLFTFEENTSHYQSQQRAARRLGDGSVVRGFVYFPSFLYTVTEIFEFATRLCLKELYRGSLEITIELKDIERFRLWYRTRPVLCRMNGYPVSLFWVGPGRSQPPS